MLFQFKNKSLMQKEQPKQEYVGDLINWSEVARRLGLSPRYVAMLRRGQRKSEKRLKQIEELISEELKNVERYWNGRETFSANQRHGNNHK